MCYVTTTVAFTYLQMPTDNINSYCVLSGRQKEKPE